MDQLETVDLNHLLAQVLDGKQQLVSYAGTSQYHVQDIRIAGSERTSISACGLIALNCARTIFRLHKEASSHLLVDGEHDPLGLLRTVLSEQTTEEIISISSAWASNDHLDVEDILDIPVFKNAFTLAETPTYTRPEFTAFSKLLQDMVDTRRDANDPVAVIITRPPEIIVCLIISTSLGNIFVVFDSHPRPLHPFGSGFIVNHTLEATSRYLNELLAVDPKLFSDPSLRWQTDLLTHFSGHILVPRQNSALDDLDEILMAASIAILQLKADQADFRRRELSHAEEKQRLIKQIDDLQRRLEPQPHLDFRIASEAFANAFYDFTADGNAELSAIEGEQSTVLEKDGGELRNTKGAEGASYLDAADGISSQEQKEEGEREKAATAVGDVQADEKVKKEAIAAEADNEKPTEARVLPPGVSFFSNSLKKLPFSNTLFSPSRSQEPPRTSAVSGGSRTAPQFNRPEPSFDRKGKQKAPNYELRASPPGNLSSKETNKSLGLKAWKGPNRGWEYLRRFGATNGKHRPQGRINYDAEQSTSNHSDLNSFSSRLTTNHTESWRAVVNHDTQDHDLANALRESRAFSSDFFDYSASDRHITQDRELANALRESTIASNSDVITRAEYPPSYRQMIQDRELTESLKESEIVYNSNVVKNPALDRQMDLDGPSPFPTPPVQKRVDDSDVASSNLAMKLQLIYDDEHRQLGVERRALQKNAQAGFLDSGICFETSPDDEQFQPFYEGQNQLGLEFDAIFGTQSKSSTQSESSMQSTSSKQSEFFECGICFDTCPLHDVAEFNHCIHRFCRSCLRECISTHLKDRQYPIYCAICKADKVDYPAEVDDVMFEALGFTLEDLQIFRTLQLAGHSIKVHCRRCQQTMFVDRDEYNLAPIMSCPLPTCNHTWCKSCNQTIDNQRRTHTCDGTAELADLVRKNKWKFCPGCKTPIAKTEGCNHMTCKSPGCNTHFCYACGALIFKSAGSRTALQEALDAHSRICRGGEPDEEVDSDSEE